MKLLRKLKSSLKILLIGGIGAVFALIGGIWYVYQSIQKDMPEIRRVADYRPPGVTQILSLEGKTTKVMAEFTKERRYLTPYDQIPQKLVQAFISAEDATFFEHQGINFVAILRAAIANFLAGQVVQGGSTITQQISKSLYLSPERNLLRKLKEFFIAFQLEKNLKKEEILYLYLNQIYLGSGAYGVQAAARTYFHKDLKSLSVAEMALIAGLPTAPGKYSPLLNPKKAKERQLYVLKRMKENRYISESEQKNAADERIRIFVNDGTEKTLAPHFIEYLRRHMIQKYGEKMLYEDGLTVTIPSAAKYSAIAQEALEAGLEEIDQRKGYRGPVARVEEKDWAEKRAELRKQITQEAFPFRFLTEAGTLDLESAIAEFDPTHEKAVKGKRLKALITQIAPDRKSASGTIGLDPVVIPLEGMKWAYPAGGPNRAPKTVSEVLAPGDLVWVKPVSYVSGSWRADLTQRPEIEGALYSVDIQTGQILAMVGGYDYATSEFNRAVQAKRQMGSTFKPIIYSAAIERGYTPASIIVDSPIVFEDKDNGTWKPENYEEKFYGDTTFRQALINSRNIPTVKIVQDIKVQTVIQQAKRLGIETAFNPDLSISLGSAVTTVQDLVHAFTAFPLQGQPFRANVFQSISDRDGRTLETSADLPSERGLIEEKPDSGSLSPFAPLVPGTRLDPRVAYVMTHLMKEVVQFGTAAKANAIGRPIAGKTGTTQDFRDGWFIGFSPRVVTGVWVGYDDQRTMGRGEAGANTALPIWVRYMSQVLKDYPADDFPVPPGISFVQVDPKSGKPVSGGRGAKEAFIAGTEPGVKPLLEPEEQSPGKKPGKGPLKIEQADDDVLREDR
jgi:penicillin-binding protein 1A